MELAVGSVFEGKVTGITKFGAFVALPVGRTGMVHISEIANTYVNDIREHLSEGQEVNVKVIGIDAEGRINLSIKKTLEAPAGARPAPERNFSGPRRGAPARPENLTFEDRLKQFMQDSDSKIAGAKYIEKKGSSRRGGRSG